MQVKRKFLSILLTLCMVLMLVPTVAFAAGDDGTVTVNGLRYRITGEDTVSVVSDTDDTPFPDYDGIGTGQATYSGEIVVPTSITVAERTYSVTKIEWAAFYRTDITKITIPSSVTVLDRLSFYYCTNLTEVDIAESGLEEIGSSAFEGCKSLSKFQIPSTVTTIESAAFGGCSSLTSLTIPKGVTDGLVKALVGNTVYPHLDAVKFAPGSPYEIEGGVLYKGTEAQLYVGPEENVVLREGTTKIADDQFNPSSGILGAFAQNYDLKSIVIPESVVSIPANAFNSAVNLESVTLPDGLQEIGTRAFYNTGLLSIELPDSVETIGSSAFQGTIHMTSAKLSSNLKSMGEGAFCDAYVLESIVIPEGITEIPAEAFAGCIALKSITLPNGLTTIGDYAFDLTTQVEGDYVNPSPQLEYINIPSTVTSLGENFIGGVKPDGQTALIMQGTIPPTGNSSFIGSNANQLNIIVPAGSEDAYAANEQFKDFVTKDDGTTEDNIGFKVELPDNITICPEKNVQLEMVYELPDGTRLTFTSSNDTIATVDELGKVTGVSDGEATITASITLNGIVLASDTCTVTVGHTTGTEWKSDETGHWKECTDCGAKLDEAEHTFKWVTDKDATATEAGSKHEECEVCGYEKTAVEIPATGSTPSTDPSKPTNPDEGDTDSPQTGDNSNLMLWITLMGVGAAGLCGALLLQKRRGSKVK